jgi:leucyl-tRNA synthetase
MEHVTLHLLYSRFWAKFLYDIGVLSCVEPYKKRTAHGMILGEDGQKMSKSRGNVINPDKVIAEHGADTLRLYEMFVGDFEKDAPWNTSSIKGCKRFLERVAELPNLVRGTGVTPALETAFHKTIKKVTNDIEKMGFNTAIAAMMSLINDINDVGSLTRDELVAFISLLCPFAPHLTEEIWESLGGTTLLSLSPFPTYDEAKTVDDTVEIPVQINGKLRSVITMEKGADKDTTIAAAKADVKVAAAIENLTIIKEIYLPDKLVNIVVK